MNWPWEKKRPPWHKASVPLGFFFDFPPPADWAAILRPPGDYPLLIGHSAADGVRWGHANPPRVLPMVLNSAGFPGVCHCHAIGRFPTGDRQQCWDVVPWHLLPILLPTGRGSRAESDRLVLLQFRVASQSSTRNPQKMAFALSFLGKADLGQILVISRREKHQRNFCSRNATFLHVRAENGMPTSNRGVPN